MARNVFDELRETLDRLAEQFPDRTRERGEEAGELFGTVSIDVSEDDDAFTVTADLPGFEKDDIDLSVEENTLHLHARHEAESKEEQREEGEERFLRRERTRRSVSRTVRLPAPVNAEEATAEFNNGVLTVTLPKREKAPGTSIDIE